MVNKTCVYKKCKSDSRRHPWIKWATFISPKVNRNLERAKKWIRLLGRPDFTIERINVHTFICEDHFPEKDHENLDWKRNPNLTPFPADHDIEKDNSKFVQGVKKPSEEEENIQNSTSNKVSRVFSWLPEGCSIHCLYNDCTSDMRLNPDLKWAEFVKPTNPNNIERASKWIDLIGRTDFTVTKINKYTYLCEKHFHEGVNLDWRKNAELEPFQINSEISVKEDPLSEKYLSKNVKEDSSNSLMEMEPENPWDIQSIYDLQYYKCPVCIYTNTSKQEFVYHAYEIHPEAVENLKFITDNSLNDVHCPWKSEPIHIKDEILENSEQTTDQCETNIEQIMIKCEPLDFDNAIEKITQQNISQTSGILEISQPVIGNQYLHKCEKCGVLFKTEFTLKKHITRWHAKFIDENVTKISNEIIQSNPKVESDQENPIIAGEILEQKYQRIKNQCGLCEQRFENLLALNLHMKSEHSMKVLKQKNKCEYCNKLFFDLPRHVKTAHEVSKEIKDNVPKDELEEGEDMDVSKILNQCGVCDKKLENLEELNLHMKSEHSMGSHKIDIKSMKIIKVDQMVKCFECEEKFVSFIKMKRHFWSVHVNLETFECHICQTVSSSRKTLKEHIIKIHEKRPVKPKKVYQRTPKTCEICNKIFKQGQGHLDIHMKRVHLKIREPKNHVCESCGQAFTKLCLLKRHIEKTHQNFTPLVCDSCGKSFDEEKYLKKHIGRVHERIRDVVCLHCQKRFYDKAGLAVHVDGVHEGKKPHKCINCGKGHSTAGNMRLHLKKCRTYVNHPQMVQN